MSLNTTKLNLNPYIERRWKIILKYIGKYRIFAPIDYNTGKTTSNEFDNYLLGKAKCECYRYDDTTLAIYFPSGMSTTNKVLPLLKELGVEMTLFLDCEGESVFHMSESMIHIAHKVLKFQTKGAKIKPTSILTARRQNK